MKLSYINYYFNNAQTLKNEPSTITQRMWSIVKNDTNSIRYKFNTATSKLSKGLAAIKATRLLIETLLAIVASIFTLPIDGMIKTGKAMVNLAKNAKAKFVKQSVAETGKAKALRIARNYAPHIALDLGILSLVYAWSTMSSNLQPSPSSPYLLLFGIFPLAGITGFVLATNDNRMNRIALEEFSLQNNQG